jgi:hypothetical protein
LEEALVRKIERLQSEREKKMGIINEKKEDAKTENDTTEKADTTYNVDVGETEELLEEEEDDEEQ